MSWVEYKAGSAFSGVIGRTVSESSPAWPEPTRAVDGTLMLGLEELTVTSTVDVPEGASTLRYEFEPTGAPDIRNGRGSPGRGQLYINDEARVRVLMAQQ